MAIKISNLGMYTAPETIQGALNMLALARNQATLFDVVRPGVDTPCWLAPPSNTKGGYPRLGNHAYVHVVIGVMHSPLAKVLGYEVALQMGSTAINGVTPMDVHHECGVTNCLRHLRYLPQPAHWAIPTPAAGRGYGNPDKVRRRIEAYRQFERAAEEWQMTLFD